MKKLILLFLLFSSYASVIAQETYTIDGTTFELKTEVDGKIDLLWNIIDHKYRYFVKTDDGKIIELVNTKGSDHKFQEEYKTTLQSLTHVTNESLEDLDLTLPSLSQFFKDYDSAVDSSKTYANNKVKIQTRLGFFGGLTNQPFIENINNTSVPFFGAEFEIFEQSNMPRNTGFLSIRHALENDDFKYSETQFALGYRFKFINRLRFNIYANLKFATFTVFNSNLVYEDADNPGTFLTEDESGSAFDTPFIFGIGSEIRINDNSFITIAYHEIFALFIDSQGNFPIDFAVGYKVNL